MYVRACTRVRNGEVQTRMLTTETAAARHAAAGRKPPKVRSVEGRARPNHGMPTYLW